MSIYIFMYTYVMHFLGINIYVMFFLSIHKHTKK